MKLLVCVILGVAILQVESRAIGPNTYQIEEQCIIDLKLDRNEIIAVVDEINTPTDNKNYGKFFVCVWKGRGVMKEDGSLDEEGVRRSFTQIFSSVRNESNAKAFSATIDELTNRCKDVHEETQGQTGIALKNCIMESLSPSDIKDK